MTWLKKVMPSWYSVACRQVSVPRTPSSATASTALAAVVHSRPARNAAATPWPAAPMITAITPMLARY